MPKLLFRRLRDTEPATQPAKSYPGDAGFDLTSSHSIVVQPGTFAQIRTNIAVALPKGVWALLKGRSSTFHRRGLIVNPGIIDSGYRGELVALVLNPNRHRVVVQEGERLFQLIPITMADIEVFAEQVEELPEGERGEMGFGSTGGFKPDVPVPTTQRKMKRPPRERRRSRRIIK
jgi:dUTP pyrophosphatase